MILPPQAVPTPQAAAWRFHASCPMPDRDKSPVPGPGNTPGQSHSASHRGLDQAPEITGAVTFSVIASGENRPSEDTKSPRVRCRARGPLVFVLRNTLLSDYARLAIPCQEDLSSSCQASATEESLMARVSMMPLESSSLAPKVSAAARSRLTLLSPEKLSTSRL